MTSFLVIVGITIAKAIAKSPAALQGCSCNRLQRNEKGS
jgi:hypothetical protein